MFEKCLFDGNKMSEKCLCDSRKCLCDICYWNDNCPDYGKYEADEMCEDFTEIGAVEDMSLDYFRDVQMRGSVYTSGLL